MRRSRLGLILVLGMLASLLPIGVVAPAGAVVTGDLLITGVVDGPLSGGVPKTIELYVVNNIADMSTYGIGSANNGGGSDGEEFTFPAIAGTAGDYIYIASENTGFTTFFGFAPDYTTSAASINGDDAIELFHNGTVVDVFGDINVDGSGESWEYLDGWAKRVDGTGQDGSTFVLSNWTFSGKNALDGEATNATASTPFPIGELPPASPPGIVINEIMQNPYAVSDGNGEWFELFNPTADPVDIDGWMIADDDSDSHLISNGGPLLIPAGGYLVLGNNADIATNGGATVDYSYGSGWYLSNSYDEVVLLTDSAAVVDRVEYDGGTWFPDPTGTSMSLIDPGYDNNDGMSWCNSGTPFGAGDLGSPGAANDCATAVAKEIHDVQGSGFSSPHVSTDVVIEGVVVGDFQGNALTTDGQDVGDQLDGFYVQEEAADWDGDGGTSEGIFVFAPDAVDVMVGDVVSVTGMVQEFFGRTQIGRVRSVGIGAIGQPTVATSVSLPVTSSSDWEQYEGMLLTFPQALHISEFYGFGRYGEIVLTTERQYQGTHVTSPGAGANAIADANALARVIVDDGRTSQNPDPAVHPNGAEFDLTNYFRGGDTVAGMTAVMDYNFGAYKLQPVYEFAAGVTYTNDNVRPPQPDDIDGDIRVASFNVLNFFTHTDDGDDSRCGPVAPHQCRGADNSVEYERQLDKLVAGIRALDADIVGIQEIENDIRTDDGERAHDAVLTLVEELNDKDGAGTWAWAGDAGYYNGYPVRNEVIYRTDAVVLDGSPMALQHEAFDLVRPSGDGLPVGRPPLAATFRPNTDKGSKQKFTVVVNHFKSKGSPCDDIGDPDTGDGQANCNLTRVAQSEALLGFVSDLQEEVSGVLVVGDLNSYAMEDPITTLEDGGLTELLKKFVGPDAYSYVFDGQLGYLDTALATRSMLNWVKGVTVFHINADEANIFDYDTSFKKSAQDALYEPLPYRVSDHDPVIVGISFGGKTK